MFVLVDCNNFYASCEKLFNPKLKNKPVVVLSNNDGCVIARSKEAKKLNIKMADPIFLHRDLIKNNLLHVFSSNFTLYGDISQRVMKTLDTFFFPMEIYSIDEAFLYINKDIDLFSLGRLIKQRVYMWTGIEVSVGIARTKTLAKLANEIAKKGNGLFVLTEQNEIELVLKKTDVEDIWGIGFNFKKKLYRLGIYTAYDLANSDDFLIKKKLSINGLKTAFELRGIKCFDLNHGPSSKKSICTSRSFAKKITNLKDLKKAIACFVSIAAKKLRKQKMHSGFLSVFIATDFFSKKNDFYSNSCHITFPTPTSYTPDLIGCAKKCLEKIFKEDLFYKKAGVILSDFTDENYEQRDMFCKLKTKKTKSLMKIMDDINYKANKKAIFFAAEGIDKVYNSLSNMRSKKHTTSFDELLEIKI